MARKAPKTEVLRALFAKSGNQCAFPGCNDVLVNEKNLFVGQICHIEAANPGGERYNEVQTDEKRRSYDNLILLCYPHHVETNDVDQYPVEILQKYKLNHESSFLQNTFKINESLLYKISADMEEYWAEVELLNTVKHVAQEFSVPIDTKGTFASILKEVFGLVKAIEEADRYFEESDNLLVKDLISFLKKLGYNTKKVEDAAYYDNPFIKRNWEMRNLGLRNHIQILKVYLSQLEIKYLEEYLKTNATDLLAKDRFEKLKIDFKKVAQTAGLAD